MVSVRFDKWDRSNQTFWVVNAPVFSAVEKLLKKDRERIRNFPRLRWSADMRQIPCIVFCHADSPYRALHRGVPVKYDIRMHRCSIFLVDFGWFQWVSCNNIIDISSMSKDVERGAPFQMMVTSYAVRDVYPVHLLGASKNITNGQNCGWQPGVNTTNRGYCWSTVPTLSYEGPKKNQNLIHIRIL
ncbi:unnamed protein product [Gongylonema pulchrum]|uniref:Tudor domain-containing protein n=1 Tax=Gongylonema pulchrum TaxID=637853 RepID=A0A183D1V5_9BILA|nr:unnamed protein product [Gongylonema pulchrum]